MRTARCDADWSAVAPGPPFDEGPFSRSQGAPEHGFHEWAAGIAGGPPGIASDDGRLYPDSRHMLTQLAFLEATHEAKAAATRFLFVLIPEAPGSSEKYQVRHLYGTPVDVWSRLVIANRNGLGIFFTVATTRGRRRTQDEVQHIRAFFVDEDTKARRDYTPCPPDLSCASARGMHHYWAAYPGQLAHFGHTQAWLAKALRTDEAVIDVSRCMRLAGFYHVKGDPVLVRVVHNERGRMNGYMSEQLMRAFPLPPGVVLPAVGSKERSALVGQADLSSAPPHFRALLSHFEDPEPVTDGYLVTCSAVDHDDSNPSLLLALREDMSIWMHCRSRRCRPRDILGALGLTWKDLYPQKRRRGLTRRRRSR